MRGLGQRGRAAWTAAVFGATLAGAVTGCATAQTTHKGKACLVHGSPRHVGVLTWRVDCEYQNGQHEPVIVQDDVEKGQLLYLSPYELEGDSVTVHAYVLGRGSERDVEKFYDKP